MSTQISAGRHARSRSPRRLRLPASPRRILIATLAALAATAAGIVPATADHNESTWSANQDSFIVNETTVHLEGDNTSIETHDLDLNLEVGDEVSFDYELFDGAKCEAGAPRVFVQPNGNTNHSHGCDGAGSPDTSGSMAFTVADAGLLDGVGLVYDSGRPGYVEISNLVIAGEPVHFLNPEPVEPEPEVVTPEEPEFTHPDCDVPGTVELAVTEGVQYSGAEDGQELEHGDSVTVEAEAEEGYVLADDAEDSWSFTAVRNPCDGQDGESIEGPKGDTGDKGEDGETVTIETPTRINTGR